MASTFMVTQTRQPKIQKLLKHALDPWIVTWLAGWSGRQGWRRADQGGHR